MMPVLGRCRRVRRTLPPSGHAPDVTTPSRRRRPPPNPRGQLAQLRSDTLDEGIEALAVVDELTVEGGDAPGQPDRFLPAGRGNRVFFAITPCRDDLELTVWPCSTYVKTKIHGAQQCSQGVDRPGAFGDHLLAGHRQNAQRHPLPVSSRPAEPRDVDSQDRACDADRVQDIGLADTATLHGSITAGPAIGSPLLVTRSARPAPNEPAPSMTISAKFSSIPRVIQAQARSRPAGELGDTALVMMAPLVALISANGWVAAWVSTPMTNVNCSATMGIATLISVQ